MATPTRSVVKQIADLDNRTHSELKAIWGSLFGGDPPAYNRKYIIRRLAYRIQELNCGGLTESTRESMRQALKTQGYDEYGTRGRSGSSQPKHRDGIPLPGTRFVRDWNGGRYEVTVTTDGFEYAGRRYRSLSAIAKAITGTHWNGRVFFGLKKERVG